MDQVIYSYTSRNWELSYFLQMDGWIYSWVPNKLISICFPPAPVPAWGHLLLPKHLRQLWGVHHSLSWALLRFFSFNGTEQTIINNNKNMKTTSSHEGLLTFVGRTIAWKTSRYPFQMCWRTRQATSSAKKPLEWKRRWQSISPINWGKEETLWLT